MSTVGEFRTALRMQCKGAFLGRGGENRRTENVVIVTDGATRKPLFRLYVKKARDRHGSQGYFWGLNENHLTWLNERPPWWLVLLCGTQEEGYIGTAEQVNQCVSSGKWPLQWSIQPSRSEYKVHETSIPREFSKCQSFQDIFTTLGCQRNSSS